MNLYTTKIMAIDPMDGQLKEWAGQHIEALSFSHARAICRTQFGYLEVTGQLQMEIDEETGDVLLDARTNLN
jgi:hypothetical protein